MDSWGNGSNSSRLLAVWACYSNRGWKPLLRWNDERESVSKHRQFRDERQRGSRCSPVLDEPIVVVCRSGRRSS